MQNSEQQMTNWIAGYVDAPVKKNDRLTAQTFRIVYTAGTTWIRRLRAVNAMETDSCLLLSANNEHPLLDGIAVKADYSLLSSRSQKFAHHVKVKVRENLFIRLSNLFAACDSVALSV